VWAGTGHWSPVVTMALASEACVGAEVTYSSPELPGPVAVDIRPLPRAFWGHSEALQLVKQDARLLSWHEEVMAGETGREFTAESTTACGLAEALLPIIETWTGLKTGAEGTWKLTSVIHRDTRAMKAGGGYTSVAHRDLDEAAVCNLLSSFLQQEFQPEDVNVSALPPLFVNAWVPLQPVEADPLAVVLPESVVLPASGRGSGGSSHDACPFLGISPGDATGLALPPLGRNHDWRWAAGMCQGDVLIWRSEQVYHGAFKHPGQRPDASRRSVDVRFHYLPASLSGATATGRAEDKLREEGAVWLPGLFLGAIQSSVGVVEGRQQQEEKAGEEGQWE